MDTEEKANELKYNVVCLAYFLKNSCILENCEIFLSNISDMWICFFPNKQGNENIYVAEGFSYLFCS